MKNALVKNFFSLVSVQVANYLLPLIVLPYLARVIGVEKFGAVAFAQAIVVYFTMLTNFGFGLYGPREISVVREDSEKLRETFWSIFYARVFLCLVSVVLFALLVAAVPKFRSETLLFVFTFGFVIGELFLPMWFFQGMERMTYIAMCNFLVKILYAVAVFTLIKQQAHYVYVPLLHSLSQVASGILAMGVIFSVFKIAPALPRVREIGLVLRKSFILFVSNISVGIYTKIHPVLLGFFAGDIYVGYYAAAEKLFNAGIGIQAQIGSTVYPHISKAARENKAEEETMTLIHKAFIVTMLVAVPAALVTFLFAGPIIRVVFGPEFMESVIVLKILSFLFIIIGMSNIFGIQTMLPFNMTREFAIPVISAGALNLIFGFILIPLYMHIGAGISYLLAETCVTLGMFAILSWKGIRFFRNLKPVSLVRELLNRKRRIEG